MLVGKSFDDNHWTGTDCSHLQYSFRPRRRKQNAIMGNLAALFLVEVLDDALKGIAAQAVDPSTLLQQLQSNEDEDFRRFAGAETPAHFRSMLKNESALDDLDFSLLVKGSNYCHTARLPAEIRHKGILTESTAIGFDTYDTGISKEEADSTVNEETAMRLVYSKEERTECDFTLNVDYNDYFYTNTKDDWKLITLPNDSEVQAYGMGQRLQGVLTICFAACRYNKCPRGDLDREAFEENLFQMNVNGESVTTMTNIGGQCELLGNARGHEWSPNGDGKYELGVKVVEPNSFVRIGAVILW